jgi:Glycosyltransferase family 87
MWRAFQRIAPPLLGVLPVLVMAVVLVDEVRRHDIAPDLHYGLYRQAKGLVDSGVPFDPIGTLMQGQNRVYTVLTTLVATPLTLVPVGVADVVVTLLLIAAVLVTPAVVGVRDLRVYGALLLWPPVISGIQSGNVTLFVGLLTACAWRYRKRRFAPGLIVGLTAAAKVFMWPLALWLVATKRYGAALAAAAVGAASVLLILPFGNPIDYFRIARSNAEAMGQQAYSVYVLFGADSAARAAWVAVAAAAVIAIFLPTLRSRSAADLSSFALAIVACILCSPIVWVHYFALLVVPLAIARPRFGPLWLVPLLYWLVPFGNPAPWQIVVSLGTMCFLAAVLVVGREATALAGAET